MAESTQSILKDIGTDPQLAEILSAFPRDEEGIYITGNKGYWSNLSKEESDALLRVFSEEDPRQAIMKCRPEYEPIIFSPKRDAAIELLNIQPGELCLDYGCMWGALSLGMAKRGGKVISFDQTYDSLRFTELRRRYENRVNMAVVQNDVKKVDLPEVADCSLVNGVLEWVPEAGDVELKKSYGKRADTAIQRENPQKIQQDFLNRTYRNLKKGGRMLLAIENRYDFTQYFGMRDPHSNLFFTSIIPRFAANMVSKMCVGRPYVNYIYSFNELRAMLHRAGYNQVDLYMVFPDYRYPELILPYEDGHKLYRPFHRPDNTWLYKSVRFVEYILIKILRGNFFSPSIIAVSRK